MTHVRYHLMIAVATVLTLVPVLLFAQTPPTASPRVEGISNQEINDEGRTGPRSTGLHVVGVGSVVYLRGNSGMTSWAWTLSSAPTGSAATLDSAATEEITFVPDVEGTYTVDLVVTNADGTSDPATVTVVAATYVGVGGMDGLPSNPGDGQCSLCHNVNFNQWAETGHASKLKRDISGMGSPFFRESCLECHTTGYDTTPTAVNDGFDDVQTELGWMFPDSLDPAVYDDMLTNFEKLAQRANIQCESCHGPGSLHKGVKANIAMTLDEASCGVCHDAAPYHRLNIQWKQSDHATGVDFGSNRDGCNVCHSGWGFIRRVDPIAGDSRPEFGNPQISCAVCHDQHRSELPSQVRSLANVTLGDGTVVDYGGKGQLCMQCHISRRDAESYVVEQGQGETISRHLGPHHSNQADMIDGTNAVEYGLPIGSSGHKFAIEDACVTCHMQETPADGQAASDAVGGHTWKMKWDGGTPEDPSDDFEHVAACQSCHGDISSFNDIMAKADFDQDGVIESTQDEVHGMLDRLGMLLPPVGLPEVRTEDIVSPATLTGEEAAFAQAQVNAAFNYRFVEEDGSFGAHNAGYALELLRRSYASLTSGDIGSADIISITDVPNDQGKQVRIAWTKFTGDGLSANPLLSYSVWRRVDDTAAAMGKVEAVASMDEMYGQANETNVGTRFKTAQAGTWDFVAWLPAAAQQTYSMVVPTLFDSTSTGMRWSVFYVSAQGANQLYESAPDSGYSVDNLVPEAPANVVLSLVNDGVDLSWDDPIDPDFRYFAVYRSTTPGFDPEGMEPYKTQISTALIDTEVEIGNTYYYRLSTFDFSGNQSVFTEEFAAIVTSVDLVDELPTEFALLQNYPNPFNPETRIGYQLPAAGHVRITVLTLLGQPVRTLVDEPRVAGSHEVIWNGLNAFGNPAPSGVYFYRIESSEFSALRKMILMK